MQYLRIGPHYYKSVQNKLVNGTVITKLLKWKKAEIITDEGKEYLQRVRKFDGFTNEPSHTNYKQDIDNFYNRYFEVKHEFNPGEFNITIQFLKHIFKDQYELALDYITILWRYPKQVLPILCLVSNERNTGKSTFIEFLKLIFQENLTINTNDDFRGRFNSDWAYKTLICIDEVLLQKKEGVPRK